MAISTNAVIEFFGTDTEVTVASPGSVAASAFSLSTDVNDWTNSDDATHAMFRLVLIDLSAAASAGETVDLYCKRLNIDGTNDERAPQTNLKQTYLGSFQVDAVDPATAEHNYIIGPVLLPNYKASQEYEFYIFNNMTPSIDAADWELWVTPIAYGPHA